METRTNGATGVVPKDVGGSQVSPRCTFAKKSVEDMMLSQQAARRKCTKSLGFWRNRAREGKLGAQGQR